ncbi:MAG: NAD(P)/FAD-dependent oxidoreductase [Trebonia sp.]
MASSPPQQHRILEDALSEPPAWLPLSETGGDLLDATDVLVVGGGLIGCALAYYLAREGLAVMLLERGELNREASGTNAGSFHLQIAIHQLTGLEVDTLAHRLLPEIRLYVEGSRLWEELETELDGSLEMHVTGGLMVAETEAELALLHAKRGIEEQAGLETHVLEGDELRSFAPFLASDLLGATYCPSEGHANPLLAAPLYALRAAEAGAAIRTGAGVQKIETHERGGFTVHTSRGAVRASRFVNAAGAWTNDIAAMLGLEHPVRRDGLHVNVTEPRERLLTPLVQHIGRRLTLKQSSNNTFIIGGGWPSQPLGSDGRYRTVWESAAGNVAVAARVLPALRDVRLLRTWSGALAFTDDLEPLVGASKRLPGYFTCMATTGFTLGPLMARLLAETLANPAGRSPLPDHFAPDRVASASAAHT